jgi:hypothetical protein
MAWLVPQIESQRGSNGLGDIHQLAVKTPGLQYTLKPSTVHG